MDKIGMVEREKTVFVNVDIQEKFVPAIENVEGVIRNSIILVKSAGILKIPLLVTEQYPKGLGHTVDRIPLSKENEIIEKKSFSCFGSHEFTKAVEKLDDVDTLVLFGIEAHVCILNTALHSLKRNYNVHVIADATSSRKKYDKEIAIERMRQSGVFIDTTESLLFQLMKEAGTEEFKQISKLIK